MAGGSRVRSPEGIRTLATAVRGRRPGPLDDGAVREELHLGDDFLAGVPGLEPRLTEPETVGLPITPYPMGGTSRRRRRPYPTARRPEPPTRVGRVTPPPPGARDRAHGGPAPRCGSRAASGRPSARPRPRRRPPTAR